MSREALFVCLLEKNVYRISNTFLFISQALDVKPQSDSVWTKGIARSEDPE